MALGGGIIALIVVAVVFFLIFVYWCIQRTPPGPSKVSPSASFPTKDQLLTYEKERKEPYWNCNKSSCRPVRYAPSGMASEKECPARTIIQMFKEACNRHGSDAALRQEVGLPPYDKALGPKQEPSKPFGEWKTWNYQQYYDESHKAAEGMLALGLKRYDAVTIYGFNCPEWFMAQNAAMMAGGIAAGIYPSDTPEQVIYKAKHSGAGVACCQGKKAKIFLDAAMKGDLPDLKAVIVWDSDIEEKEFKNEETGQVVLKTSWAKLLNKAEKQHAQMVDDTIDSLQPGDVCVFIYTSGTTGNPKAVMVTHDNLVFESMCAKSLIPESFLTEGEERVLSYLPLSHVAGCMVDIVMPIIGTAISEHGWVTVGFARVYDLSKSTIGDRLRCVEPTIFLGVPRVWEKIADKVKKIGLTITGIKKKISTFCKAKGLEHAMNCQLGGSGEHPTFFKFADKKVFGPLKGRLGLGSCKFAMTGAAPISKETLSYYGSLGLQVNEVYGMSECTGATTWSTDQTHMWGSCGFTMSGTEVKVFNCSASDLNDKKECPLSDDVFEATEEEQGEICFRGRHIMAGYMANPAFGEEHMALIKSKNASAIDADGWLHSGDKGCMGKNGMLKITGRYKELIIGAGGENIAPVPIENHIKKLCPFVSNIMMIGDKKKFNSALVTLKAVGATGESPGTNELDGEAAALVEGISTISAAAQEEKYYEQIKQAIIETNKYGKVCPNNAAKIQKFTILPHDYSVETGELTPTLKVKRSYIMKMPEYQEVIERFYSAETPRTQAYLPFYTNPSDWGANDEDAPEMMGQQTGNYGKVETAIDIE
jgi:long-chain-fatty-acid--CoA ligase ACSBG